MATRPCIALIGTGGTISFAGRDGLDVFEYMEFGRRQTVAEILARFPEVEAAAELELVDHAQLSSSGVTPADWLALVARIHEIAARAEPPDGIVLTHGTATLEETAYFLHLTLKCEIPVVLVGAQRPSSALGTDAGTNLLGAIRLAGSTEARGMGVLVLLNDEIQAAREVSKTSTFRLETFRSPDLGMLGYVDGDGRVALYRAPARPHTAATPFDVRRAGDLPRVDIAYSYAGAPPTAVEAFVDAGAEAIVMASLAPGMPATTQMDAVTASRAAGVVVIYSSRVGSGRVLRRTSMVEAGIVAADNLNPQKARVLAMLALRETCEPDALQAIFDVY